MNMKRRKGCALETTMTLHENIDMKGPNFNYPISAAAFR